MEEMASDNTEHYVYHHRDVMVFFFYSAVFVAIGPRPSTRGKPRAMPPAVFRSPLYAEGKRIAAATAGGKPVPASAINATAVTLTTVSDVGSLASVTVAVA